MSLPLAARFAARELRGGLQGFRIFLACLALGVAAIAAVGTVRASIEAGLAREGAALLGGDAVFCNVVTTDPDLPTARAQKSRQHLHGGGFTSPVRAKEPQYFTGCQFE